MVNVEIITIGNEVLLGLAQDTNSSYLCRVVRAMNGRVRHIAIVRDESDSIAAEIIASINRRADMIFTCGGLGPTDDDLTMAAIAQAARVKLILNPDARAFVERRYRELTTLGYVDSAAMTEPRLKMARLPEGARIIENPVGAAPAAMIEVEGSRIVSLPGVPAELKAIIEGPLQPLLDEAFGRGSYREREMIVECGDETVLAPMLRRVAAMHDQVYIKSRANRFGSDISFRIQISASAKSAEQAESLIERAQNDLKREFENAGISLRNSRQ